MRMRARGIDLMYREIYRREMRIYPILEEVAVVAYGSYGREEGSDMSDYDVKVFEPASRLEHLIRGEDELQPKSQRIGRMITVRENLKPLMKSFNTTDALNNDADD